MPVKTAATAADGEDIATIPSGSPMPSESADAVSNTDSITSSNLTSDSTVSLKSNNNEPIDQGEINDQGEVNVATDSDHSSKIEDSDHPTDIVTQSGSQHQLDAGGDEKLLQIDVGGAVVTQWPAAMSTSISTSQLPSQYFTMASNISTTSDTDQTLAAAEQQDELSSSLSSLSTQLLQQQLTSEGLQQLDYAMEPISNITTLPTITTTTIISANGPCTIVPVANYTNTIATSNIIATATITGYSSLPSLIDANYRLRSASLPSLAATIEEKSPRAYRVGSLSNVMMRKQGDGLESNLPVMLTTAAAVTSQSLIAVDQSTSSSTVVSVPMDDRPLLLDGENRTDGSDQAVGGARTDVSNLLEREGPLVGADSDEEGDENSVNSSTPSETNFLLDDRPYSLLDHQLQFSMFEPSNLDAVMARESLLSSHRPPVTAGQEKMVDVNPSLSQAIQVTVINDQPVNVLTTVTTAQPYAAPAAVTAVTTDGSSVTATTVTAMMKQGVSVTRSDFLHGTSKLSDVERPKAVGFTEGDKSPLATVTMPSDVIMTSSDVMRVTSSGGILPYLQLQGTVDSESDSVSTTEATEPTMDFGNSMDGIELPQGVADNFGEVKDTNSFLKELEQDELLIDQQSGTPKVNTCVLIIL